MLVERTIGVLISLIALVGFGLAGLLQARAQEPGKIGIYDLQRIADVIKPGIVVARGGKWKRANQPEVVARPRAVQKEDKEAKAKQEEITKEIRRLAQELEQPGLSEEKRGKLEGELKQQRTKLMRARQAAAKQAEVKDEDRDAVREQVQAALEKYGKEKSFSALFEKGFWEEAKEQKLALANGAMVDITQEIIDRIKLNPPPAS